MDAKVTCCWIFISIDLLVLSCFVSPVASESPQGFVSIDCGGRGGLDPRTNLDWETDDSYLQAFRQLEDENITVRASVHLESETPVDNEKQLETAMVFYPGNPNRIPRSKFCYNFSVYFNQSDEPRSYLLRATFPSRNLTTSGAIALSQYSTRFYLAVDSTYVATVDLDEHRHQIIELFISPLSTTVHVCLVPLEDRSSMPAISALELRPLDNLYPRSFTENTGGAYGPKSLQASYLILFSRLNFGGDPDLPSLRYPHDSYDRLWSSPRIPGNLSFEISIGRNRTIVDPVIDGDYSFPAEMYSTAWVGANLNTSIPFTVNLTGPRLQNPTPSFYVTHMFFGVQDSSAGVERYIDVIYDPGNGLQSYYNGLWVQNQWTWINIRKTSVINDIVPYIVRANGSSKSTPVISGFEVLGEFNPVISRTLPGDVEVIGRLFSTDLDLFDRTGDPCLPISWAWIVCSIELPPRVTQINITGKGVSGSLPLSLGGLSRLTVLDLSNNSLSGGLPSSLGNISSLRVLNLEANNLSGVLPSYSPNSFPTLEYLSLSDNQFSGNLLQLLTPLDDPLSELSVSHNSFTGSIPSELRRFTNLEKLDLSQNDLSGELDPNLWELQELQTLRLNNNRLTGTVPASLWNISSLEIANLNRNQFTRLDLTIWYSSVTEGKSFDALKGVRKVRLLWNKIADVNLPFLESDIPIPAENDRRNSLQRPHAFILLGGNPWCEKRKREDRTLIERYLCRFDEADDFWLPQSSNHGVSTEVLIVVGVLSGLLVLVMSCVLLYFLRRMRRRTRELQEIQEALAKENVKPPFFNYEDLKTATRNFSKANVLGVGGYGTVFKAEMAGLGVLAVKRLMPTEQNTSDFLKEMVNITGIKHRHLIQLKGCCVKEKQRMLVYEYAENNNLAEALWGHERQFVLSWKQRFSVCLGIARGLAYLHEELQPKMVHRDIKPQNILLDKYYNAKIADFGLVRPTHADDTQHTLNIGGTRGYMAPEYMGEGMVSEKLDVFSFGIVLLEIVSGRRCIDHARQENQIFLRNWALESYEENKLLNLVDEGLEGQYNEEEVLLVLHTALACCQIDPKKRLTMSQVVNRFMKHEDVALDIIKELRGRSRRNLENINEEDNFTESAATNEDDFSDERTLLPSSSADFTHGNGLELSHMRPR